MNLKNKFLSGVVATAAAFFIGVNVNTHSAHAASINYNYALGYNQGSPYQTANKIIVAHETANPNATAENNAIFENNNWYSSGTYVQYIVGADNQGHHAVFSPSMRKDTKRGVLDPGLTLTHQFRLN